MKPDEKELLEAVFTGDPGAFETLLDRYRALVFSVFYGQSFKFPSDYVDDLYQNFVVALAKNDYHKLRAYEGRNKCSLATFLQVVATRFALDEFRRWKRQPKARGLVRDDDEGFEVEPAAPEETGPVAENLERERGDLFLNLLFSLEWKRVSTVLWVFQGTERETIAEVMDTSRANIDALYKRAKDQMHRFFTEGTYDRSPREPDEALLGAGIRDALRPLLVHPLPALRAALLVPGAKERALVGLLLVRYPDYRVTARELEALLKGADPVATSLSVLEDLSARMEARG